MSELEPLLRSGGGNRNRVGLGPAGGGGLGFGLGFGLSAGDVGFDLGLGGGGGGLGLRTGGASEGGITSSRYACEGRGVEQGGSEGGQRGEEVLIHI